MTWGCEQFSKNAQFHHSYHRVAVHLRFGDARSWFAKVFSTLDSVQVSRIDVSNFERPMWGRIGIS